MGHVPVDLVQLATELGIEVYLSTSMREDESGAITREPGDGEHYKIFINRKHSPARRTFTLAHELGHFFCDSDYLERNGKIVEDDRLANRAISLKRSTSPPLDADLIRRDVRANKFAAELLMPEEAFIHAWQNALMYRLRRF